MIMCGKSERKNRTCSGCSAACVSRTSPSGNRIDFALTVSTIGPEPFVTRDELWEENLICLSHWKYEDKRSD